MRKADREVLDFNKKIEIIEKCQTLRIGFNDNITPYILPVSFGYEVINNSVIFYFHGAREGKKHILIEKCNRVAIELDILNGYVDLGASITADFESIIGSGTIEVIQSNEEKIHGMELILKHCKAPNKFNAQDCIKLGITDIFRIQVNEFTGKKRFN